MKKRTLLISLMALGFLASCGGNTPNSGDVGTSTGTSNSTSQTSTVASHEHDWEETVTKEAGCTKAGEKLLRCKECGETKTETIPAKGHMINGGAPFKFDTTHHWYACVAPTCDGDGRDSVTEHSFFDNNKTGVLVNESCSCDVVSYRLDIADAEGWNNPNAKMNGKDGNTKKPEWDKSTWNVEGLKAGTYTVFISAKMTHSSHSDRKWYNMALAGEETLTSNADQTTQSPYRYWLETNDGTAINPTTKLSYGEAGMDDTTTRYVEFVDTVDLKGVKELSLLHGDIGYSVVIDHIRLVAKELDPDWKPSEPESKFSIVTEVEDGYTVSTVGEETVYTFSKEGTYTLKGELKGSLNFADTLEVAAVLNLDGVTITSTNSCVYWASESKNVTLNPLAGTVNSIVSTGSDSAVKSENNIKVMGEGKLSIESAGKNALSASEITVSGTVDLDLKGAKDGMKAKAVIIEGGTIAIHDSLTGIEANLNSKGKKGTVEMSAGTITITNCGTAVKADTSITVTGGAVVVTNCTTAISGTTDSTSPTLVYTGGSITVEGELIPLDAQ